MKWSCVLPSIAAGSVAWGMMPADSVATPSDSRDPRALSARLQSAPLQVSAAVAVAEAELRRGPATLRLQEGRLYPAASPSGAAREMVFVGRGVVSVEPPDEIEAGQLELFTGAPGVDVEFQRAVLVLPDEAEARRLLSGAPAAGQADPLEGPLAEELWTGWREGPMRRLLGIDTVILRDILGDRVTDGYFAAWIQTEELEGFLYEVDPEQEEPVTLGRFVPPDLTRREEKRVRRYLERAQEREHLVGLELEDLGRFDTWMSACPRDAGGSLRCGRTSAEPEHYTLDVTISKFVDSISGTAVIDLVATEPGRLGVDLRLGLDLRVERVEDEAGAELFWTRSGTHITALLPRPTENGQRFGLKVVFSGNPFHETGLKTFALRSTISWHPHAGSLDLATYDVTLRWPKKYQVLAAGRRVEGGEGPSGTLWERRTLEIPADAFTFEAGVFSTREVRAGHIAATIAFDRDLKDLSEEAQDEIVQTVKSSLEYFEELFGPLPFDEITVVTAPRSYSQGLLGFITLGHHLLLDRGWFGAVLGIEDRRTIIAHEVAHQWWGNLIGLSSYRDDWLSEGMATYSALLYQRNRMDTSNLSVRSPWAPA